MTAKEVIEKAIATYGAEMQCTVAIEEMSELTKELCKSKRGAHNEACIAEEIADVEIMLEQLKIIYGVSDQVDNIRRQKIARLYNRLLKR